MCLQSWLSLSDLFLRSDLKGGESALWVVSNQIGHRPWRSFPKRNSSISHSRQSRHKIVAQTVFRSDLQGSHFMWLFSGRPGCAENKTKLAIVTRYWQTSNWNTLLPWMKWWFFLVRTLLETKLLLFLDVLYLSRLVGGHNVSGGRWQTLNILFFQRHNKA